MSWVAQLLRVKRGKLRLAMLVVMTGVVIGFPLLISGSIKTFAAPAYSLYLSPSSGTYAIGSTVTVDVRENSGSLPVIAAQLDLTYDTYDLTYVSSNFATSAFEIGASSNGGNGVVTFSRGTTNQNLNGDQEIGQVTFVATAPGLASVNIGNNSVVLQTANDQDEVTSLISASFTVHAPIVSKTGASTTDTPPYSPPTILSSPGSTTPTPVTETTPTSTGSTTQIAPVQSTPPSSMPSQIVPEDSQLYSGPSVSITPSGSSSPLILPNNSEVKIAAPALLRPDIAETSTSKVYKVEYYLNSKLLATVTTPPYSYNLNTSTILNGTYNLTTKAFYTDGKILTSTQVVELNNPESISQLRLAGQKYVLPWLIDAVIVLSLIYVFLIRKNPLIKRWATLVSVPIPVTDVIPGEQNDDQDERPKIYPNTELKETVIIAPKIPREQLKLAEEDKDLQQEIPLSRSHEAVLPPTNPIQPSTGIKGNHRFMK